MNNVGTPKAQTNRATEQDGGEWVTLSGGGGAQHGILYLESHLTKSSVHATNSTRCSVAFVVPDVNYSNARQTTSRPKSLVMHQDHALDLIVNTKPRNA